MDRSTLGAWVRKAEAGTLESQPQRAKSEREREAEVRQLRPENSILWDERAILNKPRPASRRRPSSDVPVHLGGEGQPQHPGAAGLALSALYLAGGSSAHVMGR
jgi:hypothetical protein